VGAETLAVDEGAEDAVQDGRLFAEGAFEGHVGRGQGEGDPIPDPLNWLFGLAILSCLQERSSRTFSDRAWISFVRMFEDVFCSMVWLVLEQLEGVLG
jgi:hypothetical protein